MIKFIDIDKLDKIEKLYRYIATIKSISPYYYHLLSDFESNYFDLFKSIPQFKCKGF